MTMTARYPAKVRHGIPKLGQEQLAYFYTHNVQTLGRSPLASERELATKGLKQIIAGLDWPQIVQALQDYDRLLDDAWK